jgi:hypothetical protein
MDSNKTRAALLATVPIPMRTESDRLHPRFRILDPKQSQMMVE